MTTMMPQGAAGFILHRFTPTVFIQPEIICATAKSIGYGCRVSAPDGERYQKKPLKTLPTFERKLFKLTRTNWTGKEVLQHGKADDQVSLNQRNSNRPELPGDESGEMVGRRFSIPVFQRA
jgi:hypothetical protein